MAAENDQNVFTSPWNDSDLVLVVEDQELHVHKWILASQSPVFKAMFDGHFKEASQDKIPLEGKLFKSMVRFLKALYPSSMFRKAKAPLDDKSRLSIVALSDEYQCVNLIEQCLDEIETTPRNVLQILPYVVKYQQTELPKLYDIIKAGVPTSKLEKLLPNVDSKMSNSMLLTKCRFLENTVSQMTDCIFSLLCDFFREREAVNDAVRSLDEANKLIEKLKISDITDTAEWYSTKAFTRREKSFSERTDSDSRCNHRLKIQDIRRTKFCPICKMKYKEKFIAEIPSFYDQNKTEHFFNTLEEGDKVAKAAGYTR